MKDSVIRKFRNTATDGKSYSMVKTMAFFLFLVALLSQALPSGAADPLNLPAPTSEKPLKSEDIRKVTKLLENPQEREKLLKTLKTLAAYQEAEEQKEGGLISYIQPIIQAVQDSFVALQQTFQKLRAAFQEGVAYLKVDKNRADIWTALRWFPLLVMMGIIFESLLKWFFRRRLAAAKGTLGVKEIEEKKHANAYFALLVPFFFSPFFLPIFISNLSIAYWVIGFWILFYSGRIFLLERHTPQPSQAGSTTRTGYLFSRVFLGVVFWCVLVWVLDIYLNVKQDRHDYFLVMGIFFSIPVLVLYLRKWRTEGMPRYLEDSYQLGTAPPVLAKPINLCIRYLPWVFLSLGALFTVAAGSDRTAFGLSEGAGCIISFIILLIFLWGRRRIDELSSAKAAFKTPFLQTFFSFITASLPQLAKAIQWVWHASFFIALIAVWNRYFSAFLSGVLSHPFSRVAISLGVIWGTIGLLWLGVNSFVHHHITPQMVKGKKKEPTPFAKTLGPMLQSIFRWAVALVGLFMSLEIFGFDLKPLVYLMSAFALAISLGSQSLVKDIINGFFTLFDGSIAVGDTVTIGNYTGVVESLSLRAIMLRHSTGALQRIPCSEMGSLINKSRDYTVIPVEVAVSYKTNIGRVYDALMQAGEEMANDPIFGKMILTPLAISGISKFVDNAVYVSGTIKIKPDPREKFVREFNRRLKDHMEIANIEPPIAFQGQWA